MTNYTIEKLADVLFLFNGFDFMHQESKSPFQNLRALQELALKRDKFLAYLKEKAFTSNQVDEVEQIALQLGIEADDDNFRFICEKQLRIYFTVSDKAKV